KSALRGSSPTLRTPTSSLAFFRNHKLIDEPQQADSEDIWLMNLNKLTEKAQEAVVEAQRVAESRQHTQVEPEHLMAALVVQDNGVVPAILDKLGVSPAQVNQRLETTLNGFARAATPGQQVYV